MRLLLELGPLWSREWISPSFLAGRVVMISKSRALLPELFSIARDKEALAFDYLDSSGSYVHWNPSFFRVVRDWELESLVAFLDLLYSSKTSLRETIQCYGPQHIISGLK
jgi:hypothetical protein